MFQRFVYWRTIERQPTNRRSCHNFIRNFTPPLGKGNEMFAESFPELTTFRTSIIVAVKVSIHCLLRWLVCQSARFMFCNNFTARLGWAIHFISCSVFSGDDHYYCGQIIYARVVDNIAHKVIIISPSAAICKAHEFISPARSLRWAFAVDF